MVRKLRNRSILCSDDDDVTKSPDPKRRSRQRRQSYNNNSNDTKEDDADITPPLPDPTPCQNCLADIPYNADRIIVHPCGHILCNFCALKSQVDRGAMPHNCPVDGCNECFFANLEYVRGGDETRDSTMIDNPFDEEYFEEKMPAYLLKRRHYNTLMESSSNQGIAICCYKVGKAKDGDYLDVESATATFVLTTEKVGNVECQRVLGEMDPVLDQVGNVFSFMHDPIAKTSYFRVDDLPVLTPREFLEMRCHRPQILDRALLAISTGYHGFDRNNYLNTNEQDLRKFYLAAIISSDILLRCIRKTPGYFQLMFKALLARQKITQDFENVCSTLNLAPSRGLTMKSRAEATLEHLRKGIKVHPRDLVLLFFDNVGFKVLGRQASYDQWIIINIVVVPEEKLTKAGFYQDDKPNNQRISRERSVDWRAKIHNISSDDATELAESIVGINTDDYDRLSTCILENIRYALDHLHVLSMEYNQHEEPILHLPRFDQIVSPDTRDESNKMMPGADGRTSQSMINSDTDEDDPPIYTPSTIVAREHIPTDSTDNVFGGNALYNQVDGAGVVGEVQEHDESATDDTRRGADNRYTKNDAHLEPWHKDLSKKDTLGDIMMYMGRSRASQSEEWKMIQHTYPDSAEPPLAEVMLGCGCDGQPAVAMRRILLEDAKRQERLYPKDVFCSFGGLHTVMKGLNASGEYFAELLTDIWSAYRDTLERIKWILFPSDPRQREEEYSFHLLANYVAAARNLREHLGKNVSAVEVNDFMVQRAEEYPICAFALLEIRIGSVMKLLRNSEKLGSRGCVSTFLTAIRLILPLFAVTHKSDYVALCQDILHWYYCASPAERKIYEEFIFTQLTSKGNTIFHDTFVELSVRDLRGLAGKVYERGMELKMEMAAANIPISNSRSADARDLHKVNSTTSSSSSRRRTHDELTVSSSFHKLVAKYNEMKIWSPNMAPVIQGYKKGTTVECDEERLDVPGGGVLHSLMLSAITELGRERVFDYFVEYYIKNYGEEKRSDKTVDLGKIGLTSELIKTKLQQELIFATSTTAKDFEPIIFTKAKLMEYVRKMCSEEKTKHPDERVDIDESRLSKIEAGNKAGIIEFLIKWRIEVFNKNPQLKRDLEAKVKADFDGKGISTKQSRRDLLTDRFFHLSNSVRANERYNVKI